MTTFLALLSVCWLAVSVEVVCLRAMTAASVTQPGSSWHWTMALTGYAALAVAFIAGAAAIVALALV